MTDSLDPTSPQRPLRRFVRLRCSLHLDDSRFDGVVTNLSEGGLYLRLAPGALTAEEIEPNTAVGVTVELPGDDGPVEMDAWVAWCKDADDGDPRGPGIGIGLSFVDLSPLITARLENFLEDFRSTVCVVDDDQGVLRGLRRTLGRDYDVVCCSNGIEALEVLEQQEVSVLITDQSMSPMSGGELLAEITRRFPNSHMVRIVITGFGNLEDLENFVNVGRISHFLHKPFDRAELINAVRRGVEAYALSVENERLRHQLEWANQRLTRENAYLRQRVMAGEAPFESIVGSSPSLKRALNELARICQSDVTVHLRGETGTGKELIARALHYGGPRAKKTFVAQNCAGLTETLMQSTLFGHTKGSFTGATRDQPGLFQQADGGTLFLDEVAELSAGMQGHLLRALQEGEITPVGASRPVQVDVRIISATHRDLREAVTQGQFREDLYYRLVVIETTLPPLRERVGDVALLAGHFLDLHCQRQGKSVPGFAAATIKALEAYHWPGNVRELENEIERAVVLADRGRQVEPAALSTNIVAARRSETRAAENGLPPRDWLDQVAAGGVDGVLKNIEREIIENALQSCDGNQSAAAKLLQLPRQTLRNRLNRLKRVP